MANPIKVKAMPTTTRLDTWLWAARFFRTRRLANLAIKGGKVHIGRNLGKAGQNIKIGMRLIIRQGYDKRTIVVLELANKRGNASQAATLYEETLESLEMRQRNKLQRKLANDAVSQTPKKPDKQATRQLRALKRQAFI